jgi:hypothetical protein
MNTQIPDEREIHGTFVPRWDLDMNSKMPETSDFRTSDLYFAAYLQTAGVPMLRTERNGSGKVSFVFDATVSNINELKNAWFSHQGRIPALPYANSIKTLKSVCHMP